MGGEPLSPPTPDRCAVRSLAASEPLHGTASVVRSWVLLEQPGAWGVQALLDSRLPADVGARLAGQPGVRTLLIRRHGRGATAVTSRTCLLAHTGPDDAWVERVRLADPADVLDLDLDALARGRRLGLEPVTDPVFLVCAHGRHDPCCAERGRPVAAALAQRFPESTWECSHVGGDRFAGNLLCFPHGLYYGRVGADDAVRVASAYAAGQVSLPHYRGRSCYAFAVQAAEAALRAATGLSGLHELRPLAAATAGDVVTCRFAAGSSSGSGAGAGGAYVVRMRVGSGVARRLSCHDAASARPPTYTLLGIDGPGVAEATVGPTATA